MSEGDFQQVKGFLRQPPSFAMDTGQAIEIPIAFIMALSSAQNTNEILQAIAHWSQVIFNADRVSIALPLDADHLSVVAMQGNSAIPMEVPIPIAGTMVGRVYAQRQSEICNDLLAVSEMDCQVLSAKGLRSCLDVPLLSGPHCYGTINIGHVQKGVQNFQAMMRLQAIAAWVATTLRIHHQIEEIQTLADTDPLTEILNRRSLDRSLSQILSNRNKQNSSFGFAVIDIYHFKSFNDRFGHAFGDKVLISVSQALQRSCRERDLVARIGGEEFCLVVPEVGQAELAAILSRFTNALSKIDFPEFENPFPVTASIGALIVQDSDTSQDDIFSKADNLMYEAKTNGRNRIIFN